MDKSTIEKPWAFKAMFAFFLDQCGDSIQNGLLISMSGRFHSKWTGDQHVRAFHQKGATVLTLLLSQGKSRIVLAEIINWQADKDFLPFCPDGLICEMTTAQKTHN